MNTADFLFPRDLEVNKTGLKRILFIGSCLSEAFVRKCKELHPDITFDFVLFNNASELPPRNPAEIAGYDLQYVQIPLRSVLSDAVVRIADNEKAKDPIDWALLGAQNVSLMLEAALGYNKDGNLLTFVSNFIVPQGRIAASLDDHESSRDLVTVIRRLNEHLAGQIKRYPHTFVADVDMIANSLGKRFFLDDVIYFSTHSGIFYPDWAVLESFPSWTAPEPGRMEPVPELGLTYENRYEEFFDAVFRQIEAMYRTIRQIDMVKVVIFDLDNTLWRGQLIEHYQEGLKWPYSDGWPMGIWEAVHQLRWRGIIVTIASKNDAHLVESKWDNALQPPFLKYDDFFRPKIGWAPKAESIRSILDELSLTARSALFIDDNPIERESVKAALPGIRAIGSDPFVVRRILLWSPETQISTRTTESARRDQMLAQQVKREQEKSVMSRSDFLASLKTRVELFEVDDMTGKSFARVFELVNKTNQFNTNGKRWMNEDYVAHLQVGGRIFGFSVVDRFTEYGIVGVVFIRDDQILQFVMSCRVLGMEIETAVLSEVVTLMRAGGDFAAVNGAITATEANTPCRDLYLRAGFSETDSLTYRIERSQPLVRSAHIELTLAESPTAAPRVKPSLSAELRAVESVLNSIPVRDPNAARLMDLLTNVLGYAMSRDLIVGPHVPSIQFGHLLELTQKHQLSLRGKDVIEFGCGAHRPLSGALLYHLCGAKRIVAFDVESMVDVGSVAAGLVAEIMSILFGNDEFDFSRAGVDRGEVLQRLASINIPALLKGDLRSGLPWSIEWMKSHYEELPSSAKAFDVLISHTVFQHINDLKRVFETLRENISPDGFMVIVIDYKDHRIYSKAATSYFQYLMDGSDHLPSYINKVRHSEFISIAAAAGFSVQECVLETTHPTQEERARFLPEFAHLSDFDISTCGARILFRPA